MRSMKPGTVKITIIMLVFTILLAACGAAKSDQTAITPTGDGLTPYYTATDTPTMTLTPATAPTATPQPTLTSTPTTYVTKEKDTMWTIAAKNGLTLAELEAANPDVDPYSMPIGTTLIIPAASSTSETETVPTPTAVAIELGSPECTPSLTGGLYCFVMASNGQDFDIQNLVVQFVLTDPESGDRMIQEGLLPLNRLTSGSTLPLFTYFAPPITWDPLIEVQILTALPVSENSQTYLDMKVEDLQASISTDGFSATVEGKVALSNSDASASRYWLAAVAYDAQGNVVGIRQLSRESELAGDDAKSFTLYVYSVSGKIDHVDVFGEAEK